MNRLERLTGILLLLQARPRTSDEIARHYEVSKRTVLRDVQALCEMGVPIIAREGVGGGYAVPDDFKLAPMPFTTHEAFLLLFALQSLDGLAGSPFAGARATLAAKLRSALPGVPQDEARQLLSAITSPRQAPRKDVRYLEPLLQAVSARTWVRLTYRSVRRTSTQIVFPHRIEAEEGLWLLEAFSREHEEYRRYRIDRIEALESLPDWAEVAPAPTAYDHADYPLIEVTVTRRGVARLDGKPDLAAHLTVLSDGSGRLAFRCPPSELDYYARLLATIGNDVDVQAPGALRDKLLDMGKQLVQRYAKR